MLSGKSWSTEELNKIPLVPWPALKEQKHTTTGSRRICGGYRSEASTRANFTTSSNHYTIEANYSGFRSKVFASSGIPTLASVVPNTLLPHRDRKPSPETSKIWCTVRRFSAKWFVYITIDTWAPPRTTDEHCTQTKRTHFSIFLQSLFYDQQNHEESLAWGKSPTGGATGSADLAGSVHRAIDFSSPDFWTKAWWFHERKRKQCKW
jgi:hypothetical protein